MARKLGWFSREVIKPIWGTKAARTADEAWDSFQEARRTPTGEALEEIVKQMLLRKALPSGTRR